MTTFCDGAKYCTAPVTLKCACGVCCREVLAIDRFHTCATHKAAASEKHLKVRDRLANWVPSTSDG